MALRRTHIKPRNDARAAAMRERNYPDPPPVPQWCAVARALQRYRAVHGEKARPEGWTDCWQGPADPAHVVHARGMGGVNSDKTEVAYLCRGHHGEQEGRTAAFEARYKIDLKAEAARVAAGETDPGAPA